MNQSTGIEVQGCPPVAGGGSAVELRIVLDIDQTCLFDPVIRVFVRKPDGAAHICGSDSHSGGLFFPWLPQGRYEIYCRVPVPQQPGAYQVCVAWGTVERVREPDFAGELAVVNSAATQDDATEFHWRLSDETASRVARLSWNQGMENWFHRHFCHAAGVIGEKFLQRHEVLKGRVLDIGAGDGITDLSLVLRYDPEELVAVDIVDYLSKLPQVCRENGLPLVEVPRNLRFLQRSCNELPFEDGYFDLVVSWGSVEHIRDGYTQALDEVWRVLRPGGIFFVMPGLYYSSHGSHLGEFDDEPHLHLKVSEQKLHEMVMSTEPKLMDRSGFDASNEDYWRYFKELNRIRVAGFEKELKAYGYRVLRAAVRASDYVEYDSALQDYSILDLGIDSVFFVLEKPGGSAGVAGIR